VHEKTAKPHLFEDANLSSQFLFFQLTVPRPEWLADKNLLVNSESGVAATTFSCIKAGT
jgi:hypothetical protein